MVRNWLTTVVLSLLTLSPAVHAAVAIAAEPPKPAPKEKAKTAAAVLAQRGITRDFLKAAARRHRAICVAKVRRVHAGSTRPLGPRNFIQTYFTSLRVYRAGRHGLRFWPSDPILPRARHFVQLPDWIVRQGRWRANGRLKPGAVYVLVLEGHAGGKWPFLAAYCVVSGLDDPVIRQVETWLRELGAWQPAATLKQ